MKGGVQNTWWQQTPPTPPAVSHAVIQNMMGMEVSPNIVSYTGTYLDGYTVEYGERATRNRGGVPRAVHHRRPSLQQTQAAWRRQSRQWEFGCTSTQVMWPVTNRDKTRHFTLDKEDEDECISLSRVRWTHLGFLRRQTRVWREKPSPRQWTEWLGDRGRRGMPHRSNRRIPSRGHHWVYARTCCERNGPGWCRCIPHRTADEARAALGPHGQGSRSVEDPSSVEWRAWSGRYQNDTESCQRGNAD